MKPSPMDREPDRSTTPVGVPGFVVLETRAHPLDANRGSAEELQDHGCAVATAP